MTVAVQIERAAAAAILYVADPECSMALAELEDAVADLAALPAEPGTPIAVALAVVSRLPGRAPAQPRAVETGEAGP